jgi:hypothetical protein
VQGVSVGILANANLATDAMKSLSGDIIAEAAKLSADLPPLSADLGLGSTALETGRQAENFHAAVRQGAYEGVLAGITRARDEAKLAPGRPLDRREESSDEEAQDLRTLSELGAI